MDRNFAVSQETFGSRKDDVDELCINAIRMMAQTIVTTQRPDICFVARDHLPSVFVATQHSPYKGVAGCHFRTDRVERDSRIHWVSRSVLNTATF
jgi:hypothetical protein